MAGELLRLFDFSRARNWLLQTKSRDTPKAGIGGGESGDGQEIGGKGIR